MILFTVEIYLFFRFPVVGTEKSRFIVCRNVFVSLSSKAIILLFFFFVINWSIVPVTYLLYIRKLAQLIRKKFIRTKPNRDETHRIFLKKKHGLSQVTYEHILAIQRKYL